MGEALVFGGHNSLDFSEIRFSVLRIPEVSLRVEEAQAIWDKECGTSFSFHHFLNADDNVFFNNINLKSLALSVVQLGLLDRYTRLFRHPGILVGNVKNDSAILVATGQINFHELICQSRASRLLRPMVPLQTADDLVLNGQSLPLFQAYQFLHGDSAPKYQALDSGNVHLQKVIKNLIEQKDIKKVVHVGPGSISKSIVLSEIESRDIQVFESIDIDPMLGWFWSELRRSEKIQPVA